ncbi:MAG: hypothetical protein H7Z14_13390 [Anaerolineae bacterium]|nr:hypothetical protein [Phycisphaerae bacterium]
MTENRPAPTLDYAKSEPRRPLLSRIRFGTIGLALSLLTSTTMFAFGLIIQPAFNIDRHNFGNACLLWLNVPALIAVVMCVWGIAQDPKSGIPYLGIIVAVPSAILAPMFMCA